MYMESIMNQVFLIIQQLSLLNVNRRHFRYPHVELMYVITLCWHKRFTQVDIKYLP